MQNAIRNIEICIFSIFPKQRAPWGVLGRPGASWRVLGLSWGGLGAVLGRFLGVWGSQDLREHGPETQTGLSLGGLLETNNQIADSQTIYKTASYKLAS